MVHVASTNPHASILVVDDAPTNRFVLRAALQRAGHSVTEAESGEQCLEICAEAPPCIVLLDCMMPGIDGIETCRRLREKYGRTSLPILMVTSLAESETLAEALAAGASDYITKPIDKVVLLARIANQLELQRSHRDLEQALEVQRTIGEMLPQALVVQSAAGLILFANSRVPKALRALPIDKMFAQLHGGIAGEAYSQISARIAQEPLVDLDFEVQRDSGVVRAVEFTSRALASPDGGILRLWLWRDTTLTRDLERKLNERVRLDMVSLFVGGVAHNFNNALMTISGAAELLARAGSEDARVARLVRIIRDGAAEAARFTHKMNVFTRPELEGDFTSYESVERIADAALTSLRIEFQERVEFRVVIEPGLPEATMSLSHLSEVVVNLLRNAAESIASKGTVSVTLNCTMDKRNIMFVVADDGIGMSADVLSRIFEPFFSTKNLDQRNFVSMRGNGLGLWNTYNLVKLSGGEITIESARGHGTVATVLLPARPPSACR